MFRWYNSNFKIKLSIEKKMDNTCKTVEVCSLSFMCLSLPFTDVDILFNPLEHFRLFRSWKIRIMAQHKDKSSLLWHTLFQQHKLAANMHSISTQPQGVSFQNVPHFGNVHFKCRPASTLGDNFMSDTFIVTATMDDETSFGGFVKVQIHLETYSNLNPTHVLTFHVSDVSSMLKFLFINA